MYSEEPQSGVGSNGGTSAQRAVEVIPLNPYSNQYRALEKMAALISGDDEEVLDALRSELAESGEVPEGIDVSYKFQEDLAQVLWQDSYCYQVAGDWEPNDIVDDLDTDNVLSDIEVDLFSLYVPPSANVYKTMSVFADELVEHGVFTGMFDSPLHSGTRAEFLGGGDTSQFQYIFVDADKKEKLLALAPLAGVALTFELNDRLLLDAPRDNAFSVNWFGMNQ